MKLSPGKKFGRWSFVKNHNRKYYGIFLCECGNVRVRQIYDIIHGKSHSCGCYSAAQARKRMTKHGMGKTDFYSSWCAMKKRCNNKNAIAYNNYGGRGIRLCKRWEKFEHFKNDMYKSYLSHVAKNKRKNTTLGRINNDRGYSMKNCRWETRAEQAKNTRRSKHIVCNGVKMNYSDWELKLNLHKGSISNRIRLGWSIEKIFNTPQGTR